MNKTQTTENQTCQLLGAKEPAKILSSQKSLPEELAAELTAILIYCQSPILCRAEHKQALRLFEITLRKYLDIVKLGKATNKKPTSAGE